MNLSSRQLMSAYTGTQYVLELPSNIQRTSFVGHKLIPADVPGTHRCWAAGQSSNTEKLKPKAAGNSHVYGTWQVETGKVHDRESLLQQSIKFYVTVYHSCVAQEGTCWINQTQTSIYKTRKADPEPLSP